MFARYKLSWSPLLIILLLYLLFPSGLSTNDGWYYAASIRYKGEIFHPNHLLYNALGLVFSWVPSKTGFEIISCMKVMNAIFAFMTLVVLQHILHSFKIPDKQVVLISCLAGFSFSLLRYATENETYIVPLFFALLASFNYIKFITNQRSSYALYSGLWAAIAVLFHQIYIFWWVGLMIGFIIEKRKKPAILYILISLICPFVYMIVFLLYKGGSGLNAFVGFILGDLKGAATLELTWKGILLSIISLIRSFIQIHGYMFNMIRENLLLLIPGILSIFFVVMAFLRFPKKCKFNVSQHFSNVHVIIIVLQFIFAMVSSGNAEFMVMIPVLIFMLVPFYSFNYEKFLFRIMVAMAVWNISYGLIPLHYKSQIQEQFLCDASLSKEDIIIIASDCQLIKNMLYYKTGNPDMKNIYKSPAVMEIRGIDPVILEGIIDSALYKGKEVYTNCLDEPTISRSSIMESTKNKDFFRKYETKLTKSWKLFTGTESIYSVRRKL